MRCDAERRSRFRWAKVFRRRPLELARSSARSPPAWKNISLVERRKRPPRMCVFGDFAHSAAPQITGGVFLECFKTEWATERDHPAFDIKMAKAFAASHRFAADDPLLIPFLLHIFSFVHKSLFVVVDWLTRSTFKPIQDTSRRRRFLQKQERESLG